jgi:hypothetical protein
MFDRAISDAKSQEAQGGTEAQRRPILSRLGFEHAEKKGAGSGRQQGMRDEEEEDEDKEAAEQDEDAERERVMHDVIPYLPGSELFVRIWKRLFSFDAQPTEFQQSIMRRALTTLLPRIYRADHTGGDISDWTRYGPYIQKYVGLVTECKSLGLITTMPRQLGKSTIIGLLVASLVLEMEDFSCIVLSTGGRISVQFLATVVGFAAQAHDFAQRLLGHSADTLSVRSTRAKSTSSANSVADIEDAIAEAERWASEWGAGSAADRGDATAIPKQTAIIARGRGINTIRALPANELTVRGAWADLVVLDEFGFMDEDVILKYMLALMRSETRTFWTLSSPTEHSSIQSRLIEKFGAEVANAVRGGASGPGRRKPAPVATVEKGKIKKRKTFRDRILESAVSAQTHGGQVDVRHLSSSDEQRPDGEVDPGLDFYVIEFVCPQCSRAQKTECPHRVRILAPWESQRRDKQLRAVFNAVADPDIVNRELNGAAATKSRRVFDPDQVKWAFAPENAYRISSSAPSSTAQWVPRYVIIGVDPSGGGGDGDTRIGSDYSLVSAFFDASGAFVVSGRGLVEGYAELGRGAAERGQGRSRALGCLPATKAVRAVVQVAHGDREGVPGGEHDFARVDAAERNRGSPRRTRRERGDDCAILSRESGEEHVERVDESLQKGLDPPPRTILQQKVPEPRHGARGDEDEIVHPVDAGAPLGQLERGVRELSRRRALGDGRDCLVEGPAVRDDSVGRQRVIRVLDDDEKIVVRLHEGSDVLGLEHVPQPVPLLAFASNGSSSSSRGRHREVTRDSDSLPPFRAQIIGAESIPRQDVLCMAAHDTILRHVKRLRAQRLLADALFVYAVELNYAPVHVTPLVAMLSEPPGPYGPRSYFLRPGKSANAPYGVLVGPGDKTRFSRLTNFYLEHKYLRVRRDEFVSARPVDDILGLFKDELDGFTRRIVAHSDPFKRDREILSGKGSGTGKDDLVMATMLALHWGVVFAALPEFASSIIRGFGDPKGMPGYSLCAAVTEKLSHPAALMDRRERDEEDGGEEGLGY